MSDDEPNPFDELGLDPSATSAALTEALRRLAERASGEERARLQSYWRALTVDEAERAALTLGAYPNPGGRGRAALTELAERLPPQRARRRLAPLAPTLADAFILAAHEEAEIEGFDDLRALAEGAEPRDECD